MNKTPYKAILEYYWNAKTKYGAHSPFLFDFVNSVFLKELQDSRICKIEDERQLLLKNHNDISFIEYGAGSKKSATNGETRKISHVAKFSLSGPWQCRVMYNLIKNYNLDSVLEIGTSLGVSTSYLASANVKGKVVTLEGNPSSARLAKELFNKLNLSQIDIKIGEFSNTLLPSLQKMKKVNAAFIDGNHHKDATIDYFNTILPFTNNKSIIIVDDIYWSQGMNEAWNHIKDDKSVAFSIDVFRMGIVFLDHDIMEKQHFRLIDFKYKPYSIGLFG